MNACVIRFWPVNTRPPNLPRPSRAVGLILALLTILVHRPCQAAEPVSLRAVPVPGAQGIGVEYRTADRLIAAVPTLGTAGVQVRVPDQEWSPLEFQQMTSNHLGFTLGPTRRHGLVVRWQLTHPTPALVQRTLEVTAEVPTRFALRFAFAPTLDRAVFATFSGPVTNPVTADTVRGAARTETFPVALVRSPDTVFGLAADSPGLWENRCQIRVDPTTQTLEVLAGDGRDPYPLIVKPPEDARDTYQYQMDGWQSLAAGETRTFTTWIFASPARNHYDAQVAAHLAVANAKGWAGSLVEAILRNTSLYLLRRNLARDAENQPRDGRYIFVSGPG